MESIFSRYKNALVLMLVLLAQVVLLAMQVRRPAPDMPDGHNVRLWRYWIASLVTPPERLAHNTGLGVRGVWSNYLYLRNLREENQRLEAENERLHLEQASLAEDALEGRRLREMLDFKGRYIDKTVPAQVIGTSGTDQAHVIYIDKGSKDGLRVQMPVITPDGIVGKIKNVFPGTAQVLLISDQTSGAGVMLQSTRIRGVMKGNASGEPQIINISPDDRIKPGEPVLSSGGDQVYPRGLPVGEVERVVADPDTAYVNVIVKPYANLAKLEEVLVVTEIADKMPFTQEKDILQSEVDALAEKQRAADILSEKLPSLEELDAPATTGSGDSIDTEVAGGSDPARPMRPPAPLHPDRYSPGAVPPAANLTPGAAPAALHRDLSPPSTSAAAGRVPRIAGSDSPAGGGQAAPLNRFPPKVVPPSVTPGETAPGEKPAAGTPVGLPAHSQPVSGITPPQSAAKPPASGGLGFKLPLQPADSTAPRRVAPPAGAPSVKVQSDEGVSRPASAATPTGGVAGAPTVKAPRPTVTGSPSATAAASGVPPAVTRSPGAAAAAPKPGAAPGSRRIVIPSESGAGGILTPAGMGSLGGAARPRPTAPAAGATAATASNEPKPPATQAGPKPATPKAQAPSSTIKVQPPPGGQTAKPAHPATAVPAKPAAQTPPTGGN